MGYDCFWMNTYLLVFCLLRTYSTIGMEVVNKVYG
jgi:hypothetical protein